jgi:hypothetical protein
MSVWREEEESISKIKHDTVRDNEYGNFSLLINSTQSKIYSYSKNYKDNSKKIKMTNGEIKRYI